MKKVTSSIDLNKIKYQIKQIDETSNCFYTSQISNDEQYLAYGGIDRILKIYDIKQDKLVRQLDFDTTISICQFTSDSSQLFVGLMYEYVYGYDVLKEFKQIFRKQIHKEYISKMIIIKSQYLITCSGDYTIRKTDIRSKKQIFKLIGHTDYIMTIDYNYIDDIIISGSWDKSIKLWKCDNRSIIINKKNLKEIEQLQLINNNQNVLSFDSYGLLLKCKIDLIKRDLIKIQEFRDTSRIQSFCQVNNGQNLLLIFEKYFKILNNQGQIIHQQNHEAGDFIVTLNRGGLLDNLRYIHINSGRKIILAIEQQQILKTLASYHTKSLLLQQD